VRPPISRIGQTFEECDEVGLVLRAQVERVNFLALERIEFCRTGERAAFDAVPPAV
jgi:hypothetical protein